MWIEYHGELYNLDKVIRIGISSLGYANGQSKCGVGIDFGDYYSDLDCMTKEKAEAVIKEICINMNRDEPYECLHVEDMLELRRRQEEDEARRAAAVAEYRANGGVTNEC